MSIRNGRRSAVKADRSWILPAVVFVFVLAAAIAYGVLNIIWWQECVQVGGVYINGEGVLPSCLRP